MRFEVEHLTTYRYSAPVSLGPQTVRLRPRPDGRFRGIGWSLLLDPAPALRAEALDAEGNLVTRLWFEAETRHLAVVSRFTLDVHEAGPPRLILDQPQRTLPVEYPAAEAAVLAPYRTAGAPSSAVAALAVELAGRSRSDPLAFLALLAERLYHGIAREIREQGAPQSPEETLSRGRGACRDQTVLFLAVARAAGFAGRFGSGYQNRSSMTTAERYLHAWPEVYVPGCGWAGFDPTRGIATGGGHVAVAASREAAGAMPLTGTFFGDARCELTFEVRIHASD